ncbi:MAG: serine/threonine protein kinase [Candidatus Obscuribacterales bacterium]|nr:serine/threonine protein kinase [Candidatus Obscuribacterales bacterium]
MAIEQDQSFCSKCGFVATGDEQTCPADGSKLSQPAGYVGATLLDKYQILQELGSGGMSVVYKVRHKMMDRIEALKMLRKELVHDASFKRFQQESQAVAALRHVNVVKVLDFGVLEDESAYLTMEFLEGKDLAAIMKNERILDVERAMPLFLQICEGLFHAHSHNVVHRDIKPGNIIITHDTNGKELAVIVDFGIAKLAGPDGSSISKLTRTGEIFGSPLYMSPEQCSGKKLDERTDIYAVGCMFYRALTGIPPFYGATPMDTMMSQIQDDARPFQLVCPELSFPASLESAILKCLAKDPKERFVSMNELRKALLGSVGLPVTDLQITGPNKLVSSRDDDTERGAEVTQGTTTSRLRLEQDEMKDSLAGTVENEPLVSRSVKMIAIGLSVLAVAVGVSAYVFLPSVFNRQASADGGNQSHQSITTRDDVFSEKQMATTSRLDSKLPHCYIGSLKVFSDWRCCSDQAESLSSNGPGSGPEQGDVYTIAYSRDRGSDLKAIAQSEFALLAKSGISADGSASVLKLGTDVKVEAILQVLDYGQKMKGAVIFYSDNGQPNALQIVPRKGSKTDLVSFIENNVVSAFLTQ